MAKLRSPEAALQLHASDAWTGGRKKLASLFSLLEPLSQRAATTRKRAERAKKLRDVRSRMLRNAYAIHGAEMEMAKLEEPAPTNLVKGQWVMLQHLSKTEWNGRHGTILQPGAAKTAELRYRVKLARLSSDVDTKPIVVNVRPRNVCVILKVEKSSLVFNASSGGKKGAPKVGRWAQPAHTPRSLGSNPRWDGANAFWAPQPSAKYAKQQRKVTNCTREHADLFAKANQILSRQTSEPRFITELARMREGIMRQRRVAHNVARYASDVATCAAAAARKAQAQAQMLNAIVFANQAHGDAAQADIDRLASAAFKRACGEEEENDDDASAAGGGALKPAFAGFLDAIVAVQPTLLEMRAAAGGNSAQADAAIASERWNAVAEAEVESLAADFLHSSIVPTMNHQNQQCESLGAKISEIEGDLDAAVRKAFKRRVARCHPDRLGRSPTEEDIAAFDAVQVRSSFLLFAQFYISFVLIYFVVSSIRCGAAGARCPEGVGWAEQVRHEHRVARGRRCPPRHAPAAARAPRARSPPPRSLRPGPCACLALAAVALGARALALTLALARSLSLSLPRSPAPRYLRSKDKQAFLRRLVKKRDADDLRDQTAVDARSQRRADARRRADERAEEAFAASQLGAAEMDEDTRAKLRDEFQEKRAAQTQQLADATPQRMRAPRLEVTSEVRVEAVGDAARAALAAEADADLALGGAWCSHEEVPSTKSVKRRKVRATLSCPAAAKGWAEQGTSLTWELKLIAHATGVTVTASGALVAAEPTILLDGRSVVHFFCVASLFFVCSSVLLFALLDGSVPPAPPLVAEFVSPFLVAGRGYTFAVRARNGYGAGPWSFDSELTVAGALAWADMDAAERAQVRQSYSFVCSFFCLLTFLLFALYSFCSLGPGAGRGASPAARQGDGGGVTAAERHARHQRRRRRRRRRRSHGRREPRRVRRGASAARVELPRDAPRRRRAAALALHRGVPALRRVERPHERSRCGRGRAPRGPRCEALEAEGAAASGEGQDATGQRDLGRRSLGGARALPRRQQRAVQSVAVRGDVRAHGAPSDAARRVRRGGGARMERRRV
jgi:hypothetical protein